MNAKLLLGVLLFLCVFCFTGCGEKDEEGYYLSPNYATATINGEEYLYREMLHGSSGAKGRRGGIHRTSGQYSVVLYFDVET